MDTQSDLVELFNHYFEVVSADTPEKRLQCYRLRYEVYCREGLIPGFHAENYPEGLERDRYDERSVHCLLMHKPRGIVAGTVRIILPAPDRRETKFPIEKFAGDAFYPDAIAFENLPRAHLGEISRLILAPEFRARKGEDRRPHGLTEDSQSSAGDKGRRAANARWQGPDRRRGVPRRTFPHAILGLFVAIVRMSVEQGLSYWYGGMEPVCARLLRTFGIDFTPISPVVDYYGPCRSYLGYVPDIIENIYRTHPQVWALLTDNGALFPRPERPLAL